MKVIVFTPEQETLELDIRSLGEILDLMQKYPDAIWNIDSDILTVSADVDREELNKIVYEDTISEPATVVNDAMGTIMDLREENRDLREKLALYEFNKQAIVPIDSDLDPETLMDSINHMEYALVGGNVGNTPVAPDVIQSWIGRLKDTVLSLPSLRHRVLPFFGASSLIIPGKFTLVTRLTEPANLQDGDEITFTWKFHV